MNIRELIEQLEDLAIDAGDDCEVRLATQPQWPFEWSISSVVSVRDGAEELEELEAYVYDKELTDDEREEAKALLKEKRLQDDEASSIVYIAEGSQLGYLPGNVSRELGWK